MGLPSRPTNKYDRAKCIYGFDDSFKILKTIFNVARECAANMSSVFVSKIPRHYVPYCNLISHDTGILQLDTKVGSRSVRIIKGNEAGFDSLRSGCFQNEQVFGVLVSIFWVEGGHLRLKTP